MLTVHHLNNSRSQRVLWLLEELGVPYEIVRYQRQPDMRAPAELRPAVADLAELIESGRSPGDLLAQRIAEIGPHATFEELTYA